MTVFGDSYGSAYYQRKPILDDDDYDMDLYVADPITQDAQGNITSSREQLEVWITVFTFISTFNSPC